MCGFESPYPHKKQALRVSLLIAYFYFYSGMRIGQPYRDSPSSPSGLVRVNGNSISLRVFDIPDPVRKNNLSTVEMIADIVAGDGHDLTTIEFSLLLYQY